MNFKLDENVALVAKRILLKRGHLAETVYDEDLVGVKDARLVDECAESGKVIVTFDKGLGDIRRISWDRFSGTVVLRLRKQTPKWVESALNGFLDRVIITEIAGKVTIVEENHHRIHGPS